MVMHILGEDSIMDCIYSMHRSAVVSLTTLSHLNPCKLREKICSNFAGWGTRVQVVPNNSVPKILGDYLFQGC